MAHRVIARHAGIQSLSEQKRTAIVVYAAVLMAAIGSPSNVARSDRSITRAISRRKLNLSHRA
jgi:hypothetical protein